MPRRVRPTTVPTGEAIKMVPAQSASLSPPPGAEFQLMGAGEDEVNGYYKATMGIDAKYYKKIDNFGTPIGVEGASVYKLLDDWHIIAEGRDGYRYSAKHDSSKPGTPQPPTSQWVVEHAKGPPPRLEFCTNPGLAFHSPITTGHKSAAEAKPEDFGQVEASEAAAQAIQPQAEVTAQPEPVAIPAATEREGYAKKPPAKKAALPKKADEKWVKVLVSLLIFLRTHPRFSSSCPQ